MKIDPHLVTANRLLDATPRADIEAFLPEMELVELTFRQVLSEPGKPMEHAYFPVSGLCSFVAMVSVDDQVEMGIVGRDGFLGASVLLQAGHDPFRIMQVLDRPGLEALANGCYGQAEAEHRRLIRPVNRP